MRKFYSDYIKHCTRFYFNVAQAPSVISDKVSYNNYVAVSNILDSYDQASVNLIKYVYTSESMAKAVSDFAFQHNAKPEELWYIIQAYEKNVAIERGLL